MDHLLYHLDASGIAWLTFNRPDSRNATSIDMLEALHGHLLRIDGNSAVRCVVLRGAGAHFMAGADLAALDEISGLPPAERRIAIQQRLARSAPVFSLIERLRQPVLASVRGAAAGGGLSFVLASDLAIAANDAKFLLAQVKVGLAPDGGSTWHMQRSIGMKQAKQLALLGEPIDASTALAWGIVNWVVAPDAIEAETARIARLLAAGATESLAQAKQLLNLASGNGLAEQVSLESRGLGLCAQSDDFPEGIRAARNKRAPTFQ